MERRRPEKEELGLKKDVPAVVVGVREVTMCQFDFDLRHHGILFHLEARLELAEESAVVKTHSPEMATAIGDFLEYHLDS